jgi:hypothetical protein
MKNISGQVAYRIRLMTSCSPMALICAKPKNKDDMHVMFWLTDLLGRIAVAEARRSSRAA